MAFNGSSGKRLCTGIDHVSERSNGGGAYGLGGGGGGGQGGELKRKRDVPSRPNHILLYTIVNPAYPITVDVINTISTPHGQVLRIVIFKKNGVQAMVEFDSLDSATRAKDALQGADIYSGCCTLKIEYAKPEKLNVFKNNVDSWDFTGSPQGGGPPNRMRPSAGFQNDDDRRRPGGPGMRRPPFFNRDQFDDMDYSGGPPPGPGLMKEPRGHHGPPHHHQGILSPYGNAALPPLNMHSHHPSHGLMHTPAQAQPTHGCVLMIYGLDPSTANADRVFNLVCLYGNIVRIKFLKSKEGTAMVQLGDALSVERCIQYLNNVTIGEQTLTLAFSKQSYLSEVMNPFPLPDKSPSFKDYSEDKNNRFRSSASTNRNRIQPPSKILHFFNTPPDVTEGQLLLVFDEYGVNPPLKISKFPLKSEKSSTGLMEFANMSQALQAVMACNHASITHPSSRFPFLMKLCFSLARSIGSGSQDQGNKQGSFNNNNNASMEQNHQDNDDDCDNYE